MKINIDFGHSALLEIDLQNDFCPGGALAVEHGDEVIPPLNALAADFAAHKAPVIATQDWHPTGHVSFKSSGKGGIWPDHCVQCSNGAALHSKLNLALVTLVIRKGFRIDMDSYSAFFENDKTTATGLEGFLKSLGIKTVYIGGLAADYCVLYSALDAARLGFEVWVLENAVRAVGGEDGCRKAFEQMRTAGVMLRQV
jgi:nicotinamidase/pyrazinamidase